MYLFRIESFGAFGHHFGYNFLEHLDVSYSVEPEPADHLNFIVTGEKVFQVFDQDFNNLGFEVGQFLLH